MSNRLELLKKPGKPALKFKPKAVARKSKEDRAKEAPAVKVEEPARTAPASTRGRGGARGGRGGRGGAYVGTHLVSSGPFALGSVGMSNPSTLKTGHTADKVYVGAKALTPGPTDGLQFKRRDGAGDGSDDEDPTRLNMNRDYALEDSETVLFPVRPHKDVELLVEPAVVLSATALAPTLRAQTVDSVKSESSDEVAPATPAEPASRGEHDKLIDDQRLIVDLVWKMDQLATDEQYVMFHLPQMAAGTPAGEVATLASPAAGNFDGQVGRLNFHKSGKISLTLNGTQTPFDCARGVSLAFLQEVYAVDSADDARAIHRLGAVAGKIVATPSI